MDLLDQTWHTPDPEAMKTAIKEEVKNGFLDPDPKDGFPYIEVDETDKWRIRQMVPGIRIYVQTPPHMKEPALLFNTSYLATARRVWRARVQGRCQTSILGVVVRYPDGKEERFGHALPLTIESATRVEEIFDRVEDYLVSRGNPQRKS
jgi:hypothetical protein